MSAQKVAFVTGGIGGIGTEICHALANQGRTVVAGYFTPERDKALAWQQAQKAAGFEFGIAGGDVSDYADSTRMLAEVREIAGPVSILVNCAGITRDKTLRRMTPDMWGDVIRTNLDSAYNVTSQVIEDMLAGGFGRIVNISSVNGQKGQFGQANYSAAKAGIHGFTKAVAQEMAGRGITVNTVSPGYVETPMTAAMPQEVLDQIVAQVPMGRMAKPSEIAFAVAYLCDDRNEYMTGANLPVNGGMYMV